MSAAEESPEPQKPTGESIKFYVAISRETKVADEISLGQELEMDTMFGVRVFTVTSIDRENGTADTRSGRLCGILERRDDGWYDQHIHGNLDGLEKVKFG